MPLAGSNRTGLANAPDPRAVVAGLGFNESQTQEIVTGQATLVVLMMSAHMDWDWILPFALLLTGDRLAAGYSGLAGYFTGKQPAEEILSTAAKYLGSDPTYRYSVCEMGFLRGFAEVDPGGFARLGESAARIHLAGAGVTSPDNVLCHGEAFIRNFLLGRLWAATAIPAAVATQCYLPDDFGHDPQLPVALQAIGMTGVAFARLPGGWPVNTDPRTSCTNAKLQAQILFDAQAIDFRWFADDGSQVIAHWMPTWYGGATGADFTTTEALGTYLSASAGPDGTGPDIMAVSPTQYVFVPVASDFQAPIEGIPGTCEQWNQGPPIPGTFCAMGTYDQFVSLVASAQLPAFGGPEGAPLDTAPYYTGIQATRPRLKILHHEATRALLGAETLAVIAARAGAAECAVAGGTPSDLRTLLLAAWGLLVPSTHHDFITGTAHPSVYRTEQIPVLEASVRTASSLRDCAAASAAAAIPVGNALPAIAIFNPVGFARSELVECDPDMIANATAVSVNDSVVPVQNSADGSALFLATLPACGYVTAAPDRSPNTPVQDPVTVTETGSSIVLENNQLSVTLGPPDSFDIASFVDKASGIELIPSGALANTIELYRDVGTEYLFGWEENPGTLTPFTAGLRLQSVEVLERGPVRVRVRVTLSCPAPEHSRRTLTYVREYRLISGEQVLRMSLTGRAPLLDAATGSTVFVRFPFAAGGVDGLVRGTPCHWTDQMPTLIWPGIVPYASHHFAIPTANRTPLATVLHRDIPAWGINWSSDGSGWTSDGSLYGAMLRNVTGSYFQSYYGWPFTGGTDSGIHTRHYALGGPPAESAATGSPLRAGMAFATTVVVAALNGMLATQSEGPLPAGSYSLLPTVTGGAIVTAAKPGSHDPSALILRLYQASNDPLTDVCVTIDPQAVPGWTDRTALHVRGVTALEQPLSSEQEAALRIRVSGSQITVNMPFAVASLAITASM